MADNEIKENMDMENETQNTEPVPDAAPDQVTEDQVVKQLETCINDTKEKVDDEEEDKGTSETIDKKGKKTPKQEKGRKVRKSTTREKIKAMQNSQNKMDNGKAEEAQNADEHSISSIKGTRSSMRIPLILFGIFFILAAIGVTVYLLYEYKPEMFGVTEAEQGPTTLATTTIKTTQAAAFGPMKMSLRSGPRMAS